MSKEIKGIIFDLDGVLVDTAKYHFRSWIKLSDELGFQLTPAIEERLKGISRMDSLNIVLESGGIQCTEEEKKAMAEKKNNWYLESLKGLEKDVILEGVLSFLNAVKSKNIPMAVGSASKNATTILRRLDMTHYFVSIIDGNHVLKTKPDPEVFVNAARDLQLEEASCLVFEDSQKGILAAKTGGFRVIGIGEKAALNEAEAVISGFLGVKIEDVIALLN